MRVSLALQVSFFLIQFNSLLLKVLRKNFNSSTSIPFFLQILSRSAARGLRFYRDYEKRLENCESTAKFCEILNNMFDALNRTSIETGLRIGCDDIRVRTLIFTE